MGGLEAGDGGEAIDDGAAPGRVGAVATEEMLEAGDERARAVEDAPAVGGAAVAVDEGPVQVVPVEHPGVVKLVLVGEAVNVPAVAAVELVHVVEVAIKLGLGDGEAELEAHGLADG